MGRLKDDIMVKKPATFTKAMALATRLIDMDEDRRVRQEDDKTPARNNDKFGFGRSRPQQPFLGGSQEDKVPDSERKLITRLTLL